MKSKENSESFHLEPSNGASILPTFQSSVDSQIEPILYQTTSYNKLTRVGMFKTLMFKTVFYFILKTLF